MTTEDNQLVESKKPIGVSIGCNCDPAVWGSHIGIRGRKANGYKTCVFDMMVSNYDGMVQAIKEDFAGFCDPVNLMVKFTGPPNNENWIYNKKYHFFFNHEAPGHANLYITEKWSSINHYIENDYEKFIERYSRRIENFIAYLKSGDPINFIINRPITDITEFHEVIKEKYPDLKYQVTFFCPNDEQYYKSLMKELDIEDSPEAKRLELFYAPKV